MAKTWMTEKWRTDPEPGTTWCCNVVETPIGTPYDRVSFPKPVFVMFEAYFERLSERFPVKYFQVFQAVIGLCVHATQVMGPTVADTALF